jgi:hypothetical protein
MIIFLAPSLGLYQPHLIHTLSIEVSTKVSLISQNQTRAFIVEGAGAIKSEGVSLAVGMPIYTYARCPLSQKYGRE